MKELFEKTDKVQEGNNDVEFFTPSMADVLSEEDVQKVLEYGKKGFSFTTMVDFGQDDVLIFVLTKKRVSEEEAKKLATEHLDLEGVI